MATWSPEKASCSYPDDSDVLSPASAAGDKPLVPSNCRGRRVTARMRAAAADAGGGVGGGGVNDGHAAMEGAVTEITGGGGVGKGRGGRGRKVEIKWVQCDMCFRWRKLAPGMGSEDLPEKW